MNLDDFQELMDSDSGYVGNAGGVQKAPEEETFHSLYISGKTRTNHINIEEKIEKFQIRGVEYNLEFVNMIIVHVKEILAKVVSEQGRDTVNCFSYKNTNPWQGTTTLENGQARLCPPKADLRYVDQFCNSCRSQIIVAGIYCGEDGKPVLTEEKKPIFIFIRAKGMRYSNVSNYLSDLYQEDHDYFITDPTKTAAQIENFHRRHVNPKRYVTKITRGSAQSSYGRDVYVFEMAKGQQLDQAAIVKMLKLSQASLKEFDEKFDWSKKSGAQSTSQAPTAPGILTTDIPAETQQTKATQQTSAQETKPVKEKKEQVFSFDDIDF